MSKEHHEVSQNNMIVLLISYHRAAEKMLDKRNQLEVNLHVIKLQNVLVHEDVDEIEKRKKDNKELIEKIGDFKD